jgi:hyperosmotically inducible periplasmic protein
MILRVHKKEQKMKIIPKALIAGLLLFPLTGISPRTDALAANGGKKTQAPRDSQAWITKEVRHQLVMLPWYSVFDNLEYKVEGNKVTLIGQVIKPVLKGDAERAVKSVEGVEAVDNEIEVLPVSSMDDQIRRAEYRAIYGFGSLELYSVRAVPPIHIIVKNGHLTLEGSVATEADKDAAGIRANGVPNVFSVTNNLRVDGGK